MKGLSLRFLLSAAAVAGLALSCGGTHAPHTSLLTEGTPCQNDADCATTLCQALPGGQAVCRRTCQAGCLPTEQCESFGTQGSPRYTCVPARTALCQPCTKPTDCPYPADLCFAVGTGNVCGMDCSYSGNCPIGYTCADRVGILSTVPGRQCVPLSNACDCTAATAGQTRACSVKNNYGTCTGMEQCDATRGWVGCTARIPAPEVCDGIDNDCNGLIDAQDPGLLPTPCEKQQGVCAASKHAVTQCVDAGWQACGAAQYGPDYEPTPEVTCDGKDNDCNGVVDDGLAAGNVNHCGGRTTVCQVANGTPDCSSACQCGILSCTAPWADCDHLYATGCEANLNTDPNNCNACGNKCVFNGVPGVCNAGVCQPSCTITNPVDVPDLNFVDSNCDGIDGDITKAIFVDGATGNDVNPGTMASPKRTIAAGIVAAVAQNPTKDVYVSKGIYPESISLANGVGVYGGYDAAQAWSRSFANTTTLQSPSTIGVAATGLTLATEIQLVTISSANATGTTAAGDGESSTAVLILNSNGGVTVRGCTLNPGNGSAGLAGTAGTTGATGGNGGAGTGATPGPAGASTCGAPGGAGAAGVNGTLPGLTGQGGTQAPGGGTAPAVGGPGGGAGYCDTFSSQPGLPATVLAAPGGPGPAGFNGTAGADFGALDATGNYLPPAGGAGVAGAPGGGGGGGGSGGGTAHGTNFFCTNCSGMTSGAGGGAGGGGCGGGPGTGGHGGGGSFSITLISSSNVTVDRTAMATGGGGTGGTGGHGGMPGGGGQGAAGAPGQYSSSCSGQNAGSGASGSAGGAGGAGGAGTGGSGGPVVCVVYKGASPAVSASPCTPGAPGAGGSGGTGPGGSTAASGPTGLSSALQASQ